MYFVNFVVNKLLIVKLLNLVPRLRALVRTEINFLSHSFDRPTIEESFSKTGPTKPRNRRKKKTPSMKIRSR